MRHGLHRHQINLLVLYFFPYIDVRATSARPTCLCTSLNTSLTTMPSRPTKVLPTQSPLTPTQTPTPPLINLRAPFRSAYCALPALWLFDLFDPSVRATMFFAIRLIFWFYFTTQINFRALPRSVTTPRLSTFSTRACATWRSPPSH